MDNCTKLKLFNIVLMLCAVNFLLYRYFSRQPYSPIPVLSDGVDSDKELGASAVSQQDVLLGIKRRPPDNTPSKLEQKALTGVGAEGGGEGLRPQSAPANDEGGVESVKKDETVVGGHAEGQKVETEGQGSSVGGEGHTRSVGGEGHTRSVGGDGHARPVGSDGQPPSTGVQTRPGEGNGDSGGSGGQLKVSDQPKPASAVSGSVKDAEIKAGEQLPEVSKEEKAEEPLELCPLVPPQLIGPLATYREGRSFDEIAHDNPALKLGGRFMPSTCTARHRVAIIVPYRNREDHLKVLLRNLHPMLIRQQLDYGIYIVDQALPGQFNRGMLMNIGYAEAMKRYDYQCAIFHDVDLIPENDKNIYSCPQMPRHLSASIDKFNYKLPYAGIYGGASAINKTQFERLNGFSNMFFGWGGEDDDMAKRLSLKGYRITRYPMEIARYKMIKHVREEHNEANPQRFALLKTTAKRQATDGLNSLVYTVQQVEELPTHTRIQVLIREEDIIKKKS